MSKLVVGCGYLGLRAACAWRETDENVFVMTRSADRAARWRAQGLSPIVADVTNRDSLARLPPVDTVLHAVGFDRNSGKSMREVYVDGLQTLLDALPDSVQRVIYISSTSVFGQLSGDWIDESAVCEPLTENGAICLAAEQALRGHRVGARAAVLRLAGIYGPDRIPRRQALAEGDPITAAPDAFLNLIHVDDAVRAVQAVERHATPGDLYLVSDGSPVVRREFYRELARLWSLPEPRFATRAAAAPPGRGATNKRISNQRLLSELKPNLNYPSYREGLAAILAAERPEPTR